MPTVPQTHPAAIAAQPGAVVLLDVRTPGEFDSGSLPGSLNCPLDQVAAQADRLRQVDRPVVLVCQTGRRAAEAHQQLTAAGLTGASVLEGGVSAWAAAGQPIDRRAARWDLHRQVRFTAGLVVLAASLAGIRWPAGRYLAGAAGAGLTYSGASGSCTLGHLLARLPCNQPTTPDPRADIANLLVRR